MLVYHGTSLSRWEKIKKEGLVPRGAHGRSNWTHSIESNPDTIYFSDAYAMNFALASLNVDALEKDHAVLIELDTDTLAPERLVPDEDALEQVSRRLKGGDGLPLHMDMVSRTRYYRSKVQHFSKKGLNYKWSLDVLGTAGYMGRIAPIHFKRVSIIDIREQADLSFHYMDSQVSVGNYSALKHKYRALTKRLFLEDYYLPEGEQAIGMGPEMMPAPNTAGIEVITLRK